MIDLLELRGREHVGAEVLRRVRDGAGGDVLFVRSSERSRAEVLRRVRDAARRRRCPRTMRSPSSGGLSRCSSPISSASRRSRKTGTPEEVRDLLSRYFEVAADVIGRYGGVVEKFIGDAVMAVWGTPVAQEDDAERAVRAALELVAAVSAFGGETGMPELGARAAVLTGEAAVNLGAAGQGMVAGDLVNAAVPCPGSRRAGHGARRRSDEKGDGGGDRVCGRRSPRAEGQDGGDAALARPPRHRRSRRRSEVARPGAAVRRTRPRAAAREGALPRQRRRAQGASALDHRHRRHRQVAARAGSSTSISTASPRTWPGTAAGASPTATA